MAVSWGSQWFAVLGEDLERCRVEMVDCRPGPLSSSDLGRAPVPEHLEGCADFASEADAVRAVRSHLLEQTREAILERVAAIEWEGLEMQRVRMLEPSSSWRESRLRSGKEDIARLEAEVKELRALRRRKIPIV